MVKIDSVSGEISLKQDFVDQSGEPMILTVIASDGAVPSLRKSSSATITIIGSRPQLGISFETDLYEATITENSPEGTSVIIANLVSPSEETIQYYIKANMQS